MGSLILDLQERAREEHLPVRLQVLKVNPARHLYERLGFRCCCETKTHLRMEWS
ncbi:MAG: N-acetyltransferase [Planctomycetota bacterium]